jgi:predicted amidohydrolase
MSEMRALGIPLVEVLRMATSNAAAVLGLDAELGALAPARPAEISIVNVLSGRWRLKDSRGDEIVATEMIHPRLSVRAGKVMRVDSPLLPDLERLAA